MVLINPLLLSFIFLLLTCCWSSALQGLDDDDDDTGRPFGSGGAGGARGVGGSKSCLYIRGVLRCGVPHDEKTVVVRFVDSVRGTMDEGYSSTHGNFEVTACNSPGGKAELHILHFCKDSQARRLKILLPEGARNEHNITDVIDLKAFYANEEAYNGAVDLPCDPF